MAEQTPRLSTRMVKVRFKNFASGAPGIDIPGAVAIADDGGEWRLSEAEIVAALNRQEPRAIGASSDHPTDSIPRGGWCERCGCGNDSAGYRHLEGCPSSVLCVGVSSTQVTGE